MSTFTSAYRLLRTAYCRRLRTRRGLSMVELMISVSITTMLLAGVVTAFVASADAVETNDQFFRATQAARVTVNQMVVECRRSDALRCDAGGADDYFDVIRPTEVLDPDEAYRRYRYDPAGRRVTLTVYHLDGTAGPTYTMVRNVAAARFGPAQTGVDANNATVVQRLPIALTVQVGRSSVTLNGAAGSRRAMKF
ncbi:MAG: hypothetical protein JWO31_3339 [Phycisphaerales bacterium]|nr:hypothetical protein [Phycisphaerales bacterium]